MFYPWLFQFLQTGLGLTAMGYSRHSVQAEDRANPGYGDLRRQPRGDRAARILPFSAAVELANLGDASLPDSKWNGGGNGLQEAGAC